MAALIVVTLAGCLGGEEGPGAPGTTTTTSGTSSSGPGPDVPTANGTLAPRLPTLAFTDCRNQGGVFAMPRAAAMAALPEGFEPMAATSPAARPDSVQFFAIAVDCQGFSIDGVAGERVQFAYAELPVTPAPAYQIGLDDCTVPLAFIATDAAVGAALQAYGLGVAGPGNLSSTAAEPDGTGFSMVSYERAEGGALQFIFGAANVDTLSVGTGDFALYGVQDGQVVSILRGTSNGEAAGGHYSTAMFQSTGIPALEGVQDAALGFAASGFGLAFAPVPLPTMA